MLVGLVNRVRGCRVQGLGFKGLRVYSRIRIPTKPSGKGR